MTKRSIMGKALWYIVMSMLAAIFVFPFFWTVTSSLKHPSELLVFPPRVFPAVPQWGNYVRIFIKVPFGRWIGNTLLVAGLSTIGMLLSASLVGYSFARFDFRGRDLIFLLTLSTMMLPAQVTLIPQFVLYYKLGWINTWLPLWVPAWFGGGAFAIFLIRQFIMSLPRDLDESALIDGATFSQIYWRILMPLCKPVLATLALISIIDRWNDFLGPVIYLNSVEKFTIAVGLNFFKNVPEQGGMPMQHLLMAASVVSTVPLIALFFSAQRYFVQGIALTGLKG